MKEDDKMFPCNIDPFSEELVYRFAVQDKNKAAEGQNKEQAKEESDHSSIAAVFFTICIIFFCHRLVVVNRTDTILLFCTVSKSVLVPPALLISLAEESCEVLPEISVLLIIHSVSPISILNCAKFLYSQPCLPFFEEKIIQFLLDLIICHS